MARSLATNLLAFGALALLLLTDVVTARCYFDGSDGILIQNVTGADGKIKCLDGFYCPNLDPDNATTFPRYCIPDPDCFGKRMQGDMDCKPQGDFEPLIIERGSFSTDGKTLQTCPSGYYCRYGATEPKKCGAMVACGEGAKKPYFYGALIIMVLMYVVLAAVVIVYRRKFAFSKLMFEAPEGESAFPSSGASTPSNNFLPMTSMNSSNSDNGAPKNRSQQVQLLCDGFKRRRGGMKPLNFEFSELKVTVPTNVGDKCILQNVSGHFKAGKVTAIMGPSGAGKTTLMSAILGKLDDHIRRTGNLRINGDLDLNALRHSIGFVPQDDVLHRELSSFKNLYYSSEIRLPNKWSSSERNMFRSAVIDIMGLTEQRDIPISDDSGQRKRASIGVELAAAPLAMFLDEPTSGLDAFSSMELCLLLREIALQTHLCVAMVIHQPRVEIWNALDEVLLLAPGGYTVYQGPQSEAQKYFETVCGVMFSPKANPCDVIMDAIAERADDLVSAWNSSPGSATEAFVSPRAKDDSRDGEESEQPPEWEGASVLRQIWLSHLRAVEKQLMVMQSFYTEMLIAALCGIILGQSMIDFQHIGTYRDPYKGFSVQPFSGLLPQMNLYALMSVSLAGATAGVRVLGAPLQNFYRETAAGHSRTAFFLGSIWAGMYRVIYSVFGFCALYYVISGFSFSFGTFFYIYLAGYFCMYAMAAPVSVLSSPRNSSLIASVLGLMLAVFSGFVDYPIWMKRLSFGFYVAEAMHLLFDGEIDVPMDNTYAKWGYEDVPPGLSFLYILLWGLVVYAFAFALLCFTNRNRQR